MDPTRIQEALQALPVFGSEESVILSRLPVETPTFEVTFVSKRGIIYKETVITHRGLNV